MAGDSSGSSTKRARRQDSVPIEQHGIFGTVRIFNSDKGWGFILGDTVGGDIFLHSKHILGNPPRFYIGHKSNTKDRDKAARYPEKPVRIQFDLAKTPDGKPQAMNVRIVAGLDMPDTSSPGDGVHLKEVPSVSDEEAASLGLDPQGSSSPSWIRDPGIGGMPALFGSEQPAKPAVFGPAPGPCGSRGYGSMPHPCASSGLWPPAACETSGNGSMPHPCASRGYPYDSMPAPQAQCPQAQYGSSYGSHGFGPAASYGPGAYGCGPHSYPGPSGDGIAGAPGYMGGSGGPGCSCGLATSHPACTMPHAMPTPAMQSMPLGHAMPPVM